MGRSFEDEKKIPRERYFNESYLSDKQFNSIRQQIFSVTKLNPRDVLEIGVGNGIVADFLKGCGIEVTTFDINPNLKPDLVGNVIELEKNLGEKRYDLILCAEVLEHIPFEYFEKILLGFSKISKMHVIITLPRMHRVIIDANIKLQLPWFGIKRKNIFLRLPKSENNFLKAIKMLFLKTGFYFRVPDRATKWDDHHWEIDWTSHYDFANILNTFKKYFYVLDTFHDPLVPEHQYFILKIKS